MSSHLENESSSGPSFCLSTQEPHDAVPNQASGTPQGPSKAASNNKLAPPLGHPYFTSIMAKSQVESPYQLFIPRKFYDSLPQAAVPVVLVCQGKAWEVKYYGDCRMRRFSLGWKNFALDNNLKVGDGCVFELLDDKELKFRVRILGGQIPPKFVQRGSFDRPINID